MPYLIKVTDAEYSLLKRVVCAEASGVRMVYRSGDDAMLQTLANQLEDFNFKKLPEQES